MSGGIVLRHKMDLYINNFKTDIEKFNMKLRSLAKNFSAKDFMIL